MTSNHSTSNPEEHTVVIDNGSSIIEDIKNLSVSAPVDPFCDDTIKDMSQKLNTDFTKLRKIMLSMRHIPTISGEPLDLQVILNKDIASYLAPISQCVLNQLDVTLGYIGRSKLKTEISKRLAHDARLREICFTQIAPLKNASVRQLITISEIVDCLDVASHWIRRPSSKPSSKSSIKTPAKVYHGHSKVHSLKKREKSTKRHLNNRYFPTQSKKSFDPDAFPMKLRSAVTNNICNEGSFLKDLIPRFGFKLSRNFEGVNSRKIYSSDSESSNTCLSKDICYEEEKRSLCMMSLLTMEAESSNYDGDSIGPLLL